MYFIPRCDLYLFVFNEFRPHENERWTFHAITWYKLTGHCEDMFFGHSSTVDVRIDAWVDSNWNFLK